MNLQFQIELQGLNHQKVDAYLVPKSRLWEQVQLCMNDLKIQQTTPTLPVLVQDLNENKKEHLD